MSLFWATFLTGACLLVLGIVYFKNGPQLRDASFAWLRSPKATFWLFGAASVWFLWYILNLGAADFGDYKTILFLLFGAVAIGSFFVVRDFLAVRGLAVLILLASRVLLDAAYMQFAHPQRLFLVTFVYLAIIIALILGATPYRMRDFYTWLFKDGNTMRPRALGAISAGYGIILIICSLSY